MRTRQKPWRSSADGRTSTAAIVITVEWHAPGETFAEWQTEDGATHKALGLTLSPDRIQVSSWSLTAHELEHLRHWRADGDPDDANHAGPPGPWTAGDNLIVAAVTAEYAETFGEQ